jgi:hypothetical protein
MSSRGLSRADRRLIDSAWAEVARAPRARVGSSTSVRSACFSADYGGVCGRCELPIRPGQDIRYHRDFAGAIHSGCRAPSVVTGPTGIAAHGLRVAKVVGARQPQLCPNCHLEHAGDCS